MSEHCGVTATSRGGAAFWLFTPEVMRQARSLLEKAQTQSAGDATAAARVDWLAKGLRQAELLLGVERGYERAVDTGDKTEFLTAYQSLKAFRAANADYDKTNFAGLAGDEQKWERKLSE